MKKYIAIGLILPTFALSYGLPWSGETVDGIHAAFQEYDQFIKEENQNLRDRYQEHKKDVTEEILANHKTKEKHLRRILKLNIETTLDKGSVNYRTEKFKRLKNKQGVE